MIGIIDGDELVAFEGRLYRKSKLEEVIEQARADERLRRDIEDAMKHRDGGASRE